MSASTPSTPATPGLPATPAAPAASAPTRTFGSDQTTRGIRVRTQPFYVPDQSDPEAGRYFFAYQVTISNEGDIAAQVLSRHWIIIDGDGDREEVKGPGVVGESPTLQPGKSFNYTSACPLETPWGTMEGTYQMRDADGVTFDAAIARFTLAMEATASPASA